MKYKKINNYWVIVLARGEKIVETLIEFCRKEKIKSGYFNAIGAINKVELAHFNPVEQEYLSKHMTGALEIVSLMGNITHVKPFNCSTVQPFNIHSHIAVSDEAMLVYGGHLKEATVSVTCEIILREFNTKINRVLDKEIGLNLIE
jgi:hypothetical protein